MTRQCYVCKVYNYQNKAKQLTFHRFPSNPETRKIWLSVLGFEEDHQFPKIVEVCSNHFQESDYRLRFDGTRYLKRGAVPLCTHSLFNPLESTSLEDTVSSPTKSQEKDDSSADTGSDDDIVLSNNFESGPAKTRLAFEDDTVLSIAGPPYKISPPSSFESSESGPAKERLTFGHDATIGISKPPYEISPPGSFASTSAKERSTFGHDAIISISKPPYEISPPGSFASTSAKGSLTFGHDTMISISRQPYYETLPSPPPVTDDVCKSLLDSMVVKHSPASTISALEAEEIDFFLESAKQEEIEWQKTRKTNSVDDLTVNDFSTPSRAKRNIYLLKKTILKRRKKIHNLQTTVLTLRKTVDTLNELLKSLINKCAIDSPDTISKPSSVEQKKSKLKENF